MQIKWLNFYFFIYLFYIIVNVMFLMYYYE